MIVTYNWLKEFVDFDLSPAELSDLLTMLGLEVEGVKSLGAGMDDVVVAVVEEKRQHPNADKLSLCKVNNGREILDVVCGAQNFKAGDRVALAQVGAVLPGDFKIKKSKIRGEESCGMLCSEKELAIADDSAGIMILPQDLPLGTPLFDALGMKDTIFEIGLTPNRADCLSVIGVAREIAAKLGKELKVPAPQVAEQGAPIDSIASVTIEDADLCPRYAARYVSGCRIAPSPRWMVERLQAVGIRSINNVVDITNYVLLEYGHPLHAFDFRTLAGSRIVVKRSAEGEKFNTLDGQERELKNTDLTIRDGEKAVALAGIMGGENSGIADDTTDILIESACFNPSAIRKTARRLGLHSESSHRFERGADVEIVPRALDRAAELIAQLAGGTVAAGVIDVYPGKQAPRTVAVRVSAVNSLLGLSLAAAEVADILRRLQFGVSGEGDTLQVCVPTFRVDIEREIDIIEEIARLVGYNNIPSVLPAGALSAERVPAYQEAERRVRNILVGDGFNEIVNFSFISQPQLEKIGLAEGDSRLETIPLLNPISEEQSVMRTSLLPGLLETVRRNLDHRVLNQRVFELRRVYLRDGDAIREPLVLGGILVGRRYAEGWNVGKDAVDFFDAKGVVESVLDALAVTAVYDADNVEPYLHPGKAARVMIGKQSVGALGELHPDVLERFEIDDPAFYFELEIAQLLKYAKKKKTITAPSRYPDTFRDIALLVPVDTASAAVVSAIQTMKLTEVEGVEIFDLYTGPGIPEGKKSLAVRVRYRSFERTLTDEEVSSLHTKIVSNLEKKLGITTR